jgi:hypothetical protein
MNSRAYRRCMASRTGRRTQEVRLLISSSIVGPMSSHLVNAYQRGKRQVQLHEPRIDGSKICTYWTLLIPDRAPTRRDGEQSGLPNCRGAENPGGEEGTSSLWEHSKQQHRSRARRAAILKLWYDNAEGIEARQDGGRGSFNIECELCTTQLGRSPRKSAKCA